MERSGTAEVAKQRLGHPHQLFELVAEIRGLEAHGFWILDAMYGDSIATS
jgi:hypothetical protein